MKKWVIFAFIASLVSAGLHFYLLERSYKLSVGQAEQQSLCNINETWSCDEAILSPYGKIFNIPLSDFGFGFNISLALLILAFFLVGLTSYWRVFSVYLSGFIVLASLVMVVISFVESLYCPFCWASYLFSFVGFLSLLWAFKKEVLEVSFVKYIMQSFKNKQAFLFGGGILVISLFVHMMFVLQYDIKGQTKIFKAVLVDWQNSPRVSFSQPPLLKMGSDSSQDVLVEFADFMCPHCKRVKDSVQQFLKTHPHVSFHFYLFPLDKTCNPALPHKRSGVSCELGKAVLCGKKQGQGWPVHDFIFDHQQDFIQNQNNPKFVRTLFEKMAQNKGLDVEAFLTCVQASSSQDLLKKQAQMGIDANIPGTPSFFLNGKAIPSFQNLTALLNFIYNEHKK